MAKKRLKRMRSRRPAWFNASLTGCSRWATVVLPDENADLWLRELGLRLSHPDDELSQWLQLLMHQEPRIHAALVKRDWSKLTAWQLVSALEEIRGIHLAIEEFLPLRYRSCPIELRRTLYLINFIVQGVQAVSDDIAEQFGDEKFQEISVLKRPLLPAMRVMYWLLAEDIIRDEIMRRREKQKGVDVAFLELVSLADERGSGPITMRVQDAGTAATLRLLNIDPASLVVELGKRVYYPLNKNSPQHGNAPSQLFMTVRQEFTEGLGAGEILARALNGEFDEFLTATANDLKDERRWHERRDRLDTTKKCSNERKSQKDDRYVDRLVISFEELSRENDDGSKPISYESKLPPHPGPAPDETLQASELRAYLENLPEDWLRVIRSKLDGQETLKGVAQTLGCSVSKVKRLIKQIRPHLTAHLNK